VGHVDAIANEAVRHALSDCLNVYEEVRNVGRINVTVCASRLWPDAKATRVVRAARPARHRKVSKRAGYSVEPLAFDALKDHPPRHLRPPKNKSVD
jgi:hypothetical protein